MLGHRRCSHCPASPAAGSLASAARALAPAVQHAAMAEKKWIPLESNPDVLNEYAGKLGVDLEASGLRFCDVWSLDEVRLHCSVRQPFSALRACTSVCSTLIRDMVGRRVSPRAAGAPQACHAPLLGAEALGRSVVARCGGDAFPARPTAPASRRSQFHSCHPPPLPMCPGRRSCWPWCLARWQRCCCSSRSRMRQRRRASRVRGRNLEGKGGPLGGQHGLNRCILHGCPMCLHPIAARTEWLAC